jgi:uncharacterized protein YhaN
MENETVERLVCCECDTTAVARLMVGSMGLADPLCDVHLTNRKARYDRDLVAGYYVVSLVHVPEGIEADYAATLGNLKDSERATQETMDALRQVTARNAELELDVRRVARQLAEERHEHEQTRTALGYHKTRADELELELAQHREPEEPPPTTNREGAVVEGQHQG